MNDVHAAFEGTVSARMPRSEAMEPGVPEQPALYERFTGHLPERHRARRFTPAVPRSARCE
jgi:hypothetical protein